MIAPEYLNKDILTLQLPFERWYRFKKGRDRYWFSNKGRTKSVYMGVERILTIGLTDDGYPRVQLSFKKKKEMLTIHRIVGELFVPNPLNLKEINHKDGNKLNFDKSNIEWSTRSHNIKHAFDMGLKDLKGIKNGNCKLTDEQVIEIRDSLLSVSDLCKIYNIKRCTVSDIQTGARWNHITNLPKRTRKSHLEEKDVIEIYKSEHSQEKLAEMYNMTTSGIRNIKNGKAHAQITQTLSI